MQNSDNEVLNDIKIIHKISQHCNRFSSQPCISRLEFDCLVTP